MSRFAALLDTSVLVPVALADTLLRLAEAGLYRPLWSETIRDLVRAVEHVHPELADGRARRRSEVMATEFPDADVEGWQPLVRSLELPDPDDRHVVAAAIRGRADVVVTANLKDFPVSALQPLDLEAQGPDTFLLNQLDLAPAVVVRVLAEQAAATRSPARSFDEVTDHLGRCGAPRFAEAVRAQRWRVG